VLSISPERFLWLDLWLEQQQIPKSSRSKAPCRDWLMRFRMLNKLVVWLIPNKDRAENLMIVNLAA
jgi:hypothetical protein